MTDDDYRTIFESIESTLIREGSARQPESAIRTALEAFKTLHEVRRTDGEYYWELVCVTFYSGFKAATVNRRIGAIRENLGDYERVARYDDDDVARVLADPRMIRNQKKITGTVANARAFMRLVHDHGSFDAYMEKFHPAESDDGLWRFRDDLQRRFSGIGPITVHHFMTEIGLPVLKPDRVLMRIFSRLRIVHDRTALAEAISAGRRFAAVTGHPIRYIDIVFVAYGQVEFPELGQAHGICVEQDPRCADCSITAFCNYFSDERS